MIPRGGHNPLEPAALGKPIVMGQHVFNFQVICDELVAEEALVLLAPEQVLSCLTDWLTDTEERKRRGRTCLSGPESRRFAAPPDRD